MPTRQRLILAVLTACIVLAAGMARADSVVTHPFVGITLIHRTETSFGTVSPGPENINVILVDLAAPGIRFLVTPQSGRLDTVTQTTRQFLTEQGGQIAVNCHYFEPWPRPSPDDGAADLVGLAASASTSGAHGHAYSPFESSPAKSYAIMANTPAINIDESNRASIVTRKASDTSGYAVNKPVTLYNALSGNAQVLADGLVQNASGTWNDTLNPRTMIGLANNNKTLVIFVVDGRQGASRGMTTAEAANMLRADYGVTDALSMDGGGSSTLCMANPTPTLINSPVGNGPVGSERKVGSNLVIFAKTPEPATLTLVAAGLAVCLMRRRMRAQ